MNENVDIFDMSQDVGGIAPLQFNRPGPVIDYLTRPMVPSPKSRRRDTLRGIASFVPFLSGELAKAEGDTLGVALSPLDALGPAGAPAKAAAKKGILSLNKVYHGSPNKNLTEASISKSKQSENFMPHVSATDSPLLAKSFTKGELGNLPEGQIYESVGEFNIIDYTSDEGKKIWDSLGKTDFERSINAKEAGFDGRKINNYEKLKIDNFYPDINYKDVKNASEIQFFKDLSLRPSTKGIASLDDDMLDLKKILDDPKLSNANKLKQAANHPSVVKAEKMMNEIPLTRDMPGYGTDEFVKNRQFNIGGKAVTGYENAVDELYKGGRTLAYREENLAIPTNIMAKNTGNRLATIVIGPPAAGKSRISNPIAIKNNATIIDADESKKILPEYKGGVGSNATHHESKVLSNEVMDVAMARGDNLVLPKVGGNPDAIRVLSENLKSNGYKVNLVLTEIDPDLALIRMNDRFIRKGRLIPADYALANKGKPNLTYEKLKQEGIADGYGKIDTTTRVGEPKKIFEDTANIFTETGL